MKLLLDGNVPRQLKKTISDLDGIPLDVFTVQEKGWNGKLNGELLQLMLADGFDVLNIGLPHLLNNIPHFYSTPVKGDHILAEKQLFLYGSVLRQGL